MCFLTLKVQPGEVCERAPVTFVSKTVRSSQNMPTNHIEVPKYHIAIKGNS